ncbi:MAG TPA: helix-turn-helix domain-containing protein, partial [Gemmataceae bacterium]|nr:helix-turn-helix domain-containing protein [Gemmataceae bacterium]
NDNLNFAARSLLLESQEMSALFWASAWSEAFFIARRQSMKTSQKNVVQDRLMGIREVVHLLGVSRRTVYRMVDELHPVKIRKRTLWRESVIRGYIQSLVG